MGPTASASFGLAAISGHTVAVIELRINGMVRPDTPMQTW